MSAGPQKLAIFNNKGGVGKSTIAVHIAYGLALKGERVLLLDMDGLTVQKKRQYKIIQMR